MNEYFKEILIILNVTAFLLSCLWCYYAFDFEPVIAMIVSATVIIGLLLEGKKGKTEQKMTPHQNSSENIERIIKEFVEKLDERYQKRYDGKFYRNFKLTLEVCENWGIPNPQKIKYENNADIGEASDVIYKTFKDKDRLLIVGKPGVGKTGLLLNLAIRLLDETDLDKKEPFPVIFNLATWSEKYGNLEDWLIDVLDSGEGLSKDLAEKLLDEERLILLLDGLDELARNEKKIEAAEIRKKCFDSINRYIQFDKNAVVCCREEEFTAVIRKDEKENFREWASAEVLKLDEWQLEQELLKAQTSKKHNVSAGYLLKQINENQNESLLEIVRTPFYLTTALEVFSEKDFQQGELSKDEKDIQDFLREKFIERRLRRTKLSNNFKSEKTKKWLKWLGQLMESKQLISFELDDLDQSDLTRLQLFRLIRGFIIGFIVGCLDGLILLLFSIISILILEKGFFFLIGYIIIFLIFSIFSAICNGGIFLIFILFRIFLEFLGGFRFRIKNNQKLNQAYKLERTYSLSSLFKIIVYSGLFISLVGGILASLFGGIVYGLDKGFIGIFEGLAVGLLFGIFFGLFIGLVSGAGISIILSFEKTEKARTFVSIKKPYQNLLNNFAFNFICLVSIFFVSYILIIGDFIYESGLLILLSVMVRIILIWYLYYEYLINHINLRLCFWMEDVMPLKYVTFLNYAVDLRILEKDGGQWRFRHQNLQEYFARLDIKE